MKITRDLSIVIVNYRGWDDLEACLGSLAGLDAEILVVDNDSGDGRFDEFAARHPQIRLIRNVGNYGYAHGCNRGAELCSGTWILFLNPDALDPGDQIEALLATGREHPKAGIIAPRQVDQNGRQRKVFDTFPTALTLLGPVRGLLRLLRPGRYPDPHAALPDWLEVDWASGSALLVRRELWADLGGWHEGFWMYSEDVDLCRRARVRGYPVFVTGRATLIHRHGGSSRINFETEALTRAEATISRHYYAHRHFGRLHAAAYHGLLMISRTLPVSIAGLLSVVVPAARLRRCGRTASLLIRYYRQVLRDGRWRSPRAVDS